MDKHGYMMGIAGSSKVVFLKYQKQAFKNQAGNREEESFIEAILPLFVILKGKRRKDNPKDKERGPYISLSEDGWTT